MLYLCSTYLLVKDMYKSIEFYEKILEMKVSVQRYDRWAQFDFSGKCIALYNQAYDEMIIKDDKNIEEHFNEAYLKYFSERRIEYGNNFVLNFWIDDLEKEYERVKKLDIGEVSEIMYINISSPYYFFTVKDPDGNLLEINGNYTAKEEHDI